MEIAYIGFEYFFVYSFLGWCAEVAFQAVSKGKIVNRGFLNGPVCPIYGFGVLAVFLTLEIAGDGKLEDQNAVTVFFFGFFLATAIELIGGWILDKTFHARWWDYSSRPFNLNGYICLEFGIIWGLGILIVVRIINPSIVKMLDMLPERIGWSFLAVFSIVFLADLIVSIMVMVGLNKRMAEIDEMSERMRVLSDYLSEKIGSRTLDNVQKVDEARLQAALAKAELRTQIKDIRAEYDAGNAVLEQKRKELIAKVQKSKYFGVGRILRAFPEMRHNSHDDVLEMLRRKLDQ